jgi:hypothetical protein
MRFYVATGLGNREQQREVVALLQGLGPRWRQTCDWTALDPARDGRDVCAATELDGLRAANLLVVLLPGGRGTHAELGFALGINWGQHTYPKRVVVWSWDGKAFEEGDAECCLIYHAPGVERVTGPLSDLVAYLS